MALLEFLEFFSHPKVLVCVKKKKKLPLTCVEFLDKFKGEVHGLFHQVVDVGSDHAVGLRADFYGCGAR